MDKTFHFLLTTIRHLASRIRAIHTEHGLSKTEIDSILLHFLDAETKHMDEHSKKLLATEKKAQPGSQKLVDIISRLEEHLSILEQVEPIQNTNNG